MKVTIEVDSKNEMDKLYAFFTEFGVNKISVIPANEAQIIKGDKSLSPDALFGIWAKEPRSIENIRNTAWTKPITDK